MKDIHMMSITEGLYKMRAQQIHHCVIGVLEVFMPTIKCNDGRMNAITSITGVGFWVRGEKGCSHIQN